MWLEAFHLLTSVHHAYTIVYLLSVKYAGATDRYLMAMRDLGLRYLTTWNLIMQLIYFSGCTAEHVLRTVAGDTSTLLKRWQRLREVFFKALVFPMGIMVCGVFWTLYNYDRDLVYPVVVDQYVAPYVNHLMHTSVVVAVFLETLLKPHHYHNRGRDLRMLLLFSCIYLFCYSYTFWTRGVWIYPMYYRFNWIQRMATNIFLTFFVPSGCYFLGEALNYCYWGKQSRQANGEQKTS